MTGLYLALAIVVAIVVALIWAANKGIAMSAAQADAEQADVRAKAADEQLEMYREATAIERDVAGMSDQELNERLRRWLDD